MKQTALDRDEPVVIYKERKKTWFQAGASTQMGEIHRHNRPCDCKFGSKSWINDHSSRSKEFIDALILFAKKHGWRKTVKSMRHEWSSLDKIYAQVFYPWQLPYVPNRARFRTHPARMEE